MTRITRVLWGWKADVKNWRSGQVPYRAYFPDRYYAGGEREAYHRAWLWSEKKERELEQRHVLTWQIVPRKKHNLGPGSWIHRNKRLNTYEIQCRVWDPDGVRYTSAFTLTNENLIDVCEQLGIFYSETVRMWDPDDPYVDHPTRYRDDLLRSMLTKEDFQRAMRMIYKDNMPITESHE